MRLNTRYINCTRGTSSGGHSRNKSIKHAHKHTRARAHTNYFRLTHNYTQINSQVKLQYSFSHSRMKECPHISLESIKFLRQALFKHKTLNLVVVVFNVHISTYTVARIFAQHFKTLNYVVYSPCIFVSMCRNVIL